MISIRRPRADHPVAGRWPVNLLNIRRGSPRYHLKTRPQAVSATIATDGFVTGMAFSPDGKHAYVAADYEDRGGGGVT